MLKGLSDGLLLIISSSLVRKEIKRIFILMKTEKVRDQQITRHL